MAETERATVFPIILIQLGNLAALPLDSVTDTVVFQFPMRDTNGPKRISGAQV
jgi:hypothetical protein